MKEFLNKTMRTFQKVDSKAAQSFKSDFAVTAESLVSALGQRPFRLSGPLNTAILDSVFSAALPLKGKLPEDFALRFQRLLADDEYLEAVTRSTADNLFVKRRIEKAALYLTR